MSICKYQICNKIITVCYIIATKAPRPQHKRRRSPPQKSKKDGTSVDVPSAMLYSAV